MAGTLSEMPLQAGDLLPHRRTAQLVTKVLHHNTESIQAIGEIPREHPLAYGDRAPSFLGIELGAQAAAALQSLTNQESTPDGRPRIGYLVRVREAAFFSEDLPVASSLLVTAHLEGAAPPVAMYRIAVTAGDVVIVSAQLSTYSGG